MDLNKPYAVSDRTDMPFHEIVELIEAATANADTDWEIHFVDDMQNKIDQYGERAIFTYRQINALKGVRDDD